MLNSKTFKHQICLQGLSKAIKMEINFQELSMSFLITKLPCSSPNNSLGSAIYFLSCDVKPHTSIRSFSFLFYSVSLTVHLHRSHLTAIDQTSNSSYHLNNLALNNISFYDEQDSQLHRDWRSAKQVCFWLVPGSPVHTITSNTQAIDTETGWPQSTRKEFRVFQAFPEP